MTYLADLIYLLAIAVLIGVILFLSFRLHRCRRRLRRHRIPTGIVIYQSRLRSQDQMAILGIAPGATGQFNAVPLPPGSAFPKGTQYSWASDDTVNTALTPSADGSSVAVAAGATIQNGATSFNLTLSASFTNPEGSPGKVGKTVSVPFNAPPPPPPPPPTDVDINQTS